MLIPGHNQSQDICTTCEHKQKHNKYQEGVGACFPRKFGNFWASQFGFPTIFLTLANWHCPESGALLTMHVVSMALTARSGEHMRPCHSQFLWLYCTVSFQDLASAWSMIKNETNSLRYNCIMQLMRHGFSVARACVVACPSFHCEHWQMELCMHFQVILQHIIIAIFKSWCNCRATSSALLHWLNNTMAYYMSLGVNSVSHHN